VLLLSSFFWATFTPVMQLDKQHTITKVNQQRWISLRVAIPFTA
jgi:hypothetical protein